MAEWPIIGHDLAVRQMKLAVENDEVPHALLITGVANLGKMTLAHTLAAALLCKAPITDRPCGTCLSCRKLRSGNHPDFMLVEPENAGSALKIDQIRDAERFLALTPNESSHKTLIISPFERATTGAANALLKTLEEPPAYANLILLADNADGLLPTIVSRSQQIPLRPLSRGVIQQALVEKWQVAMPVAERLARISGGRIGWAVQAATDPEYLRRMETILAQLFEVLKQDLPTRFETAKTVAQQDAAALEETLAYWREVWRDVLLIQTGNVETITYKEQSPSLLELSQHIDINTTVEILKTFDTIAYALRRNANTQLGVENLMLALPVC